MEFSKMEEICQGNLEKLKEIPKNKFTENLFQQLISKMEYNLNDINKNININLDSSNSEYILNYYLSQKKKIENCILYLKKIK